MDLLCQVKNAD